MNTQAIRNMIAKASKVEEKTGILHKLLYNSLKVQSAEMKEQGAKELIPAIKNYIAHVPDLLDEAERVTRNTPWWIYVSPILEASQQYFFNPEDLIPDRLGLIGLLDDAYLAHTLLQSVSDRFKLQYGKPLLSEDMTDANAYIRNFLGKDISSALDNYARTLIEGPDIQSMIQQLFAYAGNSAFMPIPDVSFGGLSAHDYANLQADIFLTS